MRDSKSLFLLLLSSVLFLFSIIILCVWGYQYYKQIQQQKGKTAVEKAAKVALPTNTVRDSLLKIYKVTLNSLDNRLDTVLSSANSLKGNLSINLREFYQLRGEIAGLLQSKEPNTGDLIITQKKIAELQQKVEQLIYRNNDVETENKRLKAILDKMGRETGSNTINSIQEGRGDKNLNYKVSDITIISTFNLNLTALANNDQDETSNAGQTEKMVGSFTIKNNGNLYSKCDIMVVVVQPNGQVLQKSTWESGSFETNEGKKIYSCKIHCETAKDESKKFNFFLTADNFQKGNYSMRIYYNGIMIGKVSKILS
jgi:hypothetical protein